MTMVADPPDRPPARPATPAKRITQGAMTRTARITVRTRWAEDDHEYRVCLEVSAENVRVMLNDKQAYDHATTVIRAASRAQYDAVMLRQSATKLRVPMATVSNMLREDRKKREPLTGVSTGPLHFDSGVDGKTGRGFVAVSVGVNRLTRWSMTEAHAYAMAVFGMTERAANETTTLRTLTGWGANEQWMRDKLVELFEPPEF